jgi:hypothetical protein
MDTNPRDYTGAVKGRGWTLWPDDSRVFPFGLNQIHRIGSIKTGPIQKISQKKLIVSLTWLLLEIV